MLRGKKSFFDPTYRHNTHDDPGVELWYNLKYEQEEFSQERHPQPRGVRLPFYLDGDNFG